MKILFVSDTYYPHLNGVYYFVCRVAPLLQDKGHRVAVIAPSENMRFSKKKIDNIDVYGMPSLPIVYYPKMRFPIRLLLHRRIKKLIHDFKPDIIHIQDHFILSKAVVEINKKLQIPIIGTNHFMPENLTALFSNNKIKRMVEKMMWARMSYVFNQVQIVTTPTETGASLIRSKLKTTVIAISSGINLTEFNTLNNKSGIKEKYSLPDKPLLLYVGRLDPEKRVEEILLAFSEAVKKIDFYFVIVGKGLRKLVLENMAVQLGVADRVIFTGFVPDEDLPYFYKLSDCFIIASRAELLSLVTLQAMACGLPVIAVNAGALPELVHHRRNGYLFDTGDKNAIIRHLCDVFKKDILYYYMAEKSVEYSLEHDICKTVNSFESIYKSFCMEEISVKKITVNEEEAAVI